MKRRWNATHTLILITIGIGITIAALDRGDGEHLGLAVNWVLLVGVYGIYPRLDGEQAGRG